MKSIVLAAGKGSRLQSEKYNMPKVLRTVNGKPLIQYVLENIDFIRQEDTTIVVGYKKEMVIETIKGKYKFATQEQQLGTGHAVMVTECLHREYYGNILVLYGDMPLVSKKTYESIIDTHIGMDAACTLLTAVVDNPPDYGRIIRNDKGNIINIIEKRDCLPQQLAINEVNVGVYVFNSRVLFEHLKLLNNKNNQQEYYLTDVPKILIKRGYKVCTCTTTNTDEIYGVNTIEELILCEELLKRGMIHD